MVKKIYVKIKMAKTSLSVQNKHNVHNLGWATLTMFLMVVMAVCVYLLMFKQSQLEDERFVPNDRAEHFFPTSAPLYL